MPCPAAAWSGASRNHAESFIFATFYKVFRKLYDFDNDYKVSIRRTLAASGFPEAAPENTRISNGFEGGPSGIQLGSSGPPPTGEELARVLIVKC